MAIVAKTARYSNSVEGTKWREYQLLYYWLLSGVFWFHACQKQKKAAYILSNDIRISENYLKKNGLNYNIKQDILVAAPNREINIDDMEIVTLKSTDEGVAFAIHIKDKLKTENTNGDSTLVRLTFINQTSDEPIIATVSRKFNVDISILQASIENIQQSTIGFTVCYLDGDNENIKQALKFLDQANVKVEVLGYV